MKKMNRSIFHLSISKRDSATGILFISLFLIGFLFIYLPAIITSIRFSFSNTDANFNLIPAGWSNYYHIFRVDPNFLRNMTTSLGSLLADVVVITFYSLFICTLINRKIAGKGIFRALLILPVAISTGCIDAYMNYSVTSNDVITTASTAMGSSFSMESITNYILSLSISQEVTKVIIGAIQNIYGIITRSGVQTIIFLAGLQSISPSVYEAAYVEGCTGWEAYWKITIPLLSPLIAVNVVYTVIDSFTRADNELMSTILSYAMDDFNYGISSAMAWSYFLLICIVLTVVLAVLNRYTFYETR